MEQLTFKRLREVNLARCDNWHEGGITDWSLSDWGVALAGEVGEAMNVIKKIRRKQDGVMAGETKDYADLADELADSMLYLDLVAARAGIDLDKATIKKFNETSRKWGFDERL